MWWQSGLQLHAAKLGLGTCRCHLTLLSRLGTSAEKPETFVKAALTRIAVATLGTGLVVLSGTATAGAFCRMSIAQGQECCDPTTSNCIFLAWQRRCLSVSIEAAGSADLPLSTVEAVVDASFGEWTDERCSGSGPFFEVARSTEASQCSIPEFNTDGGNTNTIAFISDWSVRENDPAAFALSTVWHSPTTGEIFDVDMEFNQERGAFGVCPSPRGCVDGTADLQNVLTHEAGHFFGIGHSDVTTATMFPSSSPGEVSRRDLAADDRAGYCAAYPEGRLPTACNFQPIGGQVNECGGGDGCGCSVIRWNSAGLGSLLPGLAVAMILLGSRRRRAPR